jgi:LmbE family N-acetylglucosaminyl deacetylase
MKTALVVAAHPDDEVLGCGGVVARMADEGWAVDILLMAEGLTSREPERDANGRRADLDALGECARRAAAILGARGVRLETFPDNRMDGVELLDVVKCIEREVERCRPVRVLTHHLGDVNVDHGIVHRAVAAACRPLPGASVREVLYFEVASSTEWGGGHSTPAFSPNLFIDIGATLERKLRALAEYGGELRTFPHPRSLQAVEHLARWRGASAGCAAAEAFEIGRRIE